MTAVRRKLAFFAIRTATRVHRNYDIILCDATNNRMTAYQRTAVTGNVSVHSKTDYRLSIFVYKQTKRRDIEY